MSNRIHPMFVSVPEGAEVPPSSEGHVYTGAVEGGRWIDAADLQAGDRLLNDDGSWAAVASVQIETEALIAYNLTVEEWHTYFVAGEAGAEPVWVYNNCGPRVNQEPSNSELSARDDLKGRFGEDIDPVTFDNGGSLTGSLPVKRNASDNVEHELQIALEFAESGRKVEIKGGSRSDGLDLEVDGRPFEVTQVMGTSPNSVFDSAFRKVTSNTVRNSGGSVVVDARRIGVSARDALTRPL